MFHLCLVLLISGASLCGSSYNHIEKYVTVEPMHLNSDIKNKQDLKTVEKSKTTHYDETRYMFSGYGRMFDLRITKNKNLLSNSFTTITQASDGSHQIKEFGENCYYHGYVYGSVDSYVTITTCKGLRGVIYDGEEYFIEPSQEYLSDSANHSNKHILYKTEHIKLEKDGKCGGEHMDNHLESLNKEEETKKRRHRRSVGIERYIEMVMVMDNREYQKHGMKGSIQRAIEITNYVDFVYKTLNTRVALISVIVWNVFDMVQVNSKPGVTLTEFKKYTADVLQGSLKLSLDNAQLITGIDFDGSTVGLAPIGVICSIGSCAVNQDHNSNAMVVANTVAHEMGHNLGMYHFGDGCTCARYPCVMSASVNLGTNVKGFTNCSTDAFNKSVSAGHMPCIDDYPEKLYGHTVCGNGYKEKGEECDCGTEQDCKKSGAFDCCNHLTCKLKASAQCAEGVCCQDCKFKEQGTACRARLNKDCDLEEYCTGYSSQCPKNFYLKDGTSCQNGKSYCFKGSCKSLDEQCQTLWGPNAVRTPHKQCYDQNENGDEYANCGKDIRGRYIKCKPNDVLCGTLQCAAKSPQDPLPRLPIIGSPKSKQVIKISSSTTTIYCVQGRTTLGAEIDDPTVALAGTKCGEGMLCLTNACVNISALPLKQCSAKCLNGGVCNNNGNCHCKPGYACPYCELVGPGGSFDSGQGCLVVGDCDCISSLEKAILVLIFVVLPVAVIVGYILYRYKNTGTLAGLFSGCRITGKRSKLKEESATIGRQHLAYGKSIAVISSPVIPVKPNTPVQPRKPPPPPQTQTQTPDNKPVIPPRRAVFPNF